MLSGRVRVRAPLVPAAVVVGWFFKHVITPHDVTETRIGSLTWGQYRPVQGRVNYVLPSSRCPG